MKKTNITLKAGIVTVMALLLILPGAAMAINTETLSTNSKTFSPLNRGGGWTEQASSFWIPAIGIRYLDAIDSDTAWAVGYDGSGGNYYETWFTKTSNGGDLWYANTVIGDPDYGLGNICGIDGDTAWAAVFYTGAQDDTCGIYKTINGGTSWTHQEGPLQGAESFANNVFFWNENDGMCQGDLRDGYFEVYTTSNGGTDWTRVPEEDFTGDAPISGEGGWTGCIDVIGDTVTFGTNKGNIWKSDDKGYTWTVSYTGIGPGGLNEGVNEIAFKDSNNGLAAHDNGASYDLYTTSNGGGDWEQITPSGTAYSSGLSYVPGTDNMYVCTGAATGYSGASYSFDGGYTWADYPEMFDIQMLSCDFVEGGIGWAGAFNIDEYTGGMFKYTPSTEPDLFCSGDIAWVDVTPGETVTDSFTVQNVGAAGTELDWEIESYPDWGTWIFDPDSGLDLTSETGVITVDVEVVAPDDPETEFTGEIVLVNSEDPEDTCTIDVALATPVSQESFIIQFFERLSERFPIAFQIMHRILETLGL